MFWKWFILDSFTIVVSFKKIYKQNYMETNDGELLGRYSVFEVLNP